MALTDFIRRACVQTAVYWGTPVADGYGGTTFAAPVEIYCRWTENREIIQNSLGEQEISNAQVIVLQDVDEQGYLYLGELDDLSSNPSDPKAEDDTFEIKKFDKIPELRSTTNFLRKAYL